MDSRKRAASAALAALGISGAACADEYAVEFAVSANPANLGQYRIANVKATLTPRDGGAVGLVRAAESIGLPNGWATFLHTLEAADEKGDALSPRYVGGGRWTLDGWESGPVTLAYTMLLQHDRFPNDPGEDELAYARDWGVMWTGRALFMEGAGTEEDIAVSFTAPADWRFSTPWKLASKDSARFTAADTDDLIDSAFMAGRHLETVLPIAGNEARIGVAPPLRDLEPSMRATLSGALGAYRGLFAADMPDTLLVLIGDSHYSGGGVMGRSISMILGDDENNLPAYIAAHEGFHVWNVQWRYAQEAGELEWLKEGLAEYYTHVVAARTGAMPKEAAIAAIAGRAGLYLAALQKDSIAGGGARKLQDEASYNLVYSGGMMLCAALDAQIREASNGARSLDDLLADLHAAHAGAAELTVASLAAVLSAEYGVDGEAFFAAHLYGREPLDLVAVFAAFGLDADIRKGEVTLSPGRAPEAGEALRAWLG